MLERKINRAEGMVREERRKDRNEMFEYIRGIIKYINNTKKDMDR